MTEVWRLTVRERGRVTRERHRSLADALTAATAEVARLAPGARRDAAKVFHREVAPVAQVAARVELAGPGRWAPAVRAGIDVRGDGSSEAWTGRVRREVVPVRSGEDAVSALSRRLAADAG